ncbi:hypothetical protein LZ32DRAFT_324332 [Colletotrichum eremochloae]|nr:hypothetical protein LZ32DRAFT_324332 [Colletotrichum eremochloae]
MRCCLATFRLSTQFVPVGHTDVSVPSHAIYLYKGTHQARLVIYVKDGKPATFITGCGIPIRAVTLASRVEKLTCRLQLLTKTLSVDTLKAWLYHIHLDLFPIEQPTGHRRHTDPRPTYKPHGRPLQAA